MKHVIFYVVIVLFLFSCKNTETVYSCDSQINQIIKSGILEFSNISLKEFLEYDIELQRAIYRSFTPDKRKSFWLEKIDSVMVNPDLRNLEIEHVEKLRTHIVNSSFDFHVNELNSFKDLKNFEDEWINYATNKLNWNIYKIGFFVNSLCIEELQYNQIITDEMNAVLDSPDCGCSIESDYCFLQGGRNCVSTVCTTETEPGCGWLYQYSCNGACN